MNYKLEKIIAGLSKYIEGEIYTAMNDFQEVVARIAVGRLLDNKEAIKSSLMHNEIIRALGLIDTDGMVDIGHLSEELKREIERKGKLTISMPMFGKISFDPNDVDILMQYIREER